MTETTITDPISPLSITYPVIDDHHQIHKMSPAAFVNYLQTQPKGAQVMLAWEHLPAYIGQRIVFLGLNKGVINDHAALVPCDLVLGMMQEHCMHCYSVADEEQSLACFTKPWQTHLQEMIVSELGNYTPNLNGPLFHVLHDYKKLYRQFMSFILPLSYQENHGLKPGHTVQIVVKDHWMQKVVVNSITQKKLKQLPLPLLRDTSDYAESHITSHADFLTYFNAYYTSKPITLDDAVIVYFVERL